MENSIVPANTGDQVELRQGTQVLGDGVLVQSEYVRDLTRAGWAGQAQHDQQYHAAFDQGSKESIV